jgi:phenylacetate-CoA ligase
MQQRTGNDREELRIANARRPEETPNSKLEGSLRSAREQHEEHEPAAAIPARSPLNSAFPDREEIERLQLRKINALCAAVVPQNPFYARKFATWAEAPRFESLAEYTENVPFTSRHELVRDRLANPPYGTNLTFPLEAYVRCHQTSGTTTVPIRWLDTAESWSHIVENWIQILRAAGVTTRDRFFFAFSFGPFLGFWSAIEAVQKMGCFCFPGGSMSSLARLQAIVDNGITVLCCTPTYAQHLGQVAREKQVSLERCRLRLVVVAGESGGSIPATRARIERLFPGARVFDHHGMTEVGPVTYQCPAKPGVLHVLESAYFPEVINPDDDSPTPWGQTGELTLTTLDRIGSPLFRYRTGDLVKPSADCSCACGREDFALEGGILGRSDDMVIVRGVNIYPSLIEEIVRGCSEVNEYRVQLDRRKPMAELSLEIEAVADASEPGSLASRLEETFHAALNLRIPVHLVPAGSLPRFEMKAQRWVKATE